MLKLSAVVVVVVSVLLPAPAVAAEGCNAYDVISPECGYTATEHGGLGGYGAEPGGWIVKIVRKTERKPTIVRSAGGFETYACGVVRPGDRVTASAGPGSGVFVGNPGICLYTGRR
ncbi:MAG: hypothetical protein ACRDKJ_03255 [Actinomycetota bacterium]